MCEEVQEPSRQVPKAIIGTVIFNTIAGLVFLIPIVFVLHDTEALASLASGQPVPAIIRSAIGNEVGTFLLLLNLAVLALLCGIGCTTAVSRAIWAFARDGGIPYSTQWRKVNKALDVPLNAMMLGMVVEILLGLIYFGSSTAFNAFSGVGVITLTVSYACPIAVSVIGRRQQVENGDFNLGKLGVFCNIVALVPLFCMPSAVPATAETVNYAPVVFVAFIMIATAWYFIWGREKYIGPPTADVVGIEPHD
ncbi:hypothetical protein N7468_001509 [Penicillium chermesinum]|uniref:Amino acid permease n=1 Tax=Penicillium chermesinum TaxID=63820 RepID=A0A9W9PGP5_9EURO|nr:uncharacterized protein N7468_001509 [Penicillium chermesinum]KAJ5246526.1 hypothetical protein N7468_001509 [Penicillium chermesinum]